MTRDISLKDGNLKLNESEVEGFLERVVTPLGTSAKADVPKKYMNRRVYVIVTKTEVKSNSSMI